MERKIQAELMILCKQRQLLADSLIFYEQSSLFLLLKENNCSLQKEVQRERSRKAICRIEKSVDKTIASISSIIEGLKISNGICRKEEIILMKRPVILELEGEVEMIRKNCKFILETANTTTTTTTTKAILEVRQGEYPSLMDMLSLL